MTLMLQFKQYLSEDIINVLDIISNRLKAGKLDDIQNSHMNLLAALRVYIVRAYKEKAAGGTPIGINAVIGDVSDKDAIRAIATFAKSNDNQKLTSTQSKSVHDLFIQGKDDGHADLIQAIQYIKNKLQMLHD